MNTLPKISVVTPCLNSEYTIRQTIESVLSQNYPDFEHIVMDGGSTDGTIGILKEYPHLAWQSGQDEGHYDAMNRGVSAASGDVIGILNADDCYRDHALRAVGRAFRAHPDWDALFGDVIFVDSEGHEIFRRKETGYDYDILRFGMCYVSHPTLFLTKETYAKTGGYRHREFLNCCDYDLILRLGRDGYRVGHVRTFLVAFRIHEFGQTADLRGADNMHKEASQLRREHGLPGGWGGRLLKVFARAKREVLKLVLRGTCDLVPGGVKMRRHMRDQTTFSSNIGLDEL
jgi:glycosyltransferase involved in cell wall biosynthesis